MPQVWREIFALAGRACLTTLAWLTAAASLMYVLGDPAHFHPLFRARYTEHLVLVRTHGVPAVLVLALGPLLLWNRLRTAAPVLHRVLGWLCVVALLVAGVSGLRLATLADGGMVTRAGLCTLGTLWLFTAGFAVASARRGRWAEHRRFMVRNFALTFGAVTLRIYLNGLTQLGFDYEDIYPCIAWLAWLPNLIFAEWLLSQKSAPRPGSTPGGNS